MTGHDFLPLAQRLAGGGTEPEWRTAVSRAYYAAFHGARQLLAGLGFRAPFGDRAHAYLWYRLANSGDASVQRAGNDLGELRRRRNQADYDLVVPLAQARALSQVHLGEQIIHVLDALTPATRTRITDAIKVYERDVLHDVTWHP
jgi:uncharacterized protein (UPF0332 family)